MDGLKAMTFILMVFFLGLAILMVILGFSTNILGGEPQEMMFESPEGLTQPEEGWLTPVYDPMTRVKVTVEASETVEVLLFSSNYRGGRLYRDETNTTLIRDEWLIAGELSDRTGTDVVLSDYTSVSCQYLIRVMSPQSGQPSDAQYTITIEASTTNLDLITMGVVLFMGVFFGLVILGQMGGRQPTLAEESRDVYLHHVNEPLNDMRPSPSNTHRPVVARHPEGMPGQGHHPVIWACQQDSNIYLAKG